MSSPTLLPVLLAIVCCLPATAGAATAIDNFEEGPLSITLGPSTPPFPVVQPINQSALSASNVLTGTRAGQFSMTGQSAMLTIEPGGTGLDDGVLRMTTAPDSSATVGFTLVNDPTGFDLLAYGTAIEVLVEAAPATPDMFMQFTDTSVRQSQLAMNYHGTGSYVWPIPQGIGSSADGRELARVTWRATIPAGAELRIASITIIPEPASCATALAAAAGMLLRRRRRLG